MDISARRQLLINDYEKYGDFQSGEYRGVKWEAVRASDKSSRESSPETSPVLSRTRHKRDIYRGLSHFLCGYITLDKKLFTRDSSIYEDCMLKQGENVHTILIMKKVLNSALIAHITWIIRWIRPPMVFIAISLTF